MTSFKELGLSGKACKATSQLGYTAATPVQERAIPLVLEGRDVIAAAQTGTGKTAAFALPCMDKLDRAGRGAGPTMLVITPTRELATQVGEVCGAIAKQTRHTVMVVVGGVSYKPQVEGLARGCDVLIATPGRLEDLIAQEAADLSLVTTLVLDEADRMLDMGFLPSVERIVKRTNPDRQTLLFSATIGPEVQRVSKRLMTDPAKVEVARRGETAEAVEQYIIRIAHAAKPSLLAALLRERGAERVIVFARTRHRADACCRGIRKAGFSVDVIHSGRSQNQRKRALDGFAEGRVGVLVATDVLARGIDVDQVSYVVNYDLPAAPEDYVHRIGRTGRAGQAGVAISFVSPENEEILRDIEKLTRQKLEETEVAGFDKEAVEREAEDRALQNALRREKDPEVAQAMREMAAAEKADRKKRARAAAADGREEPAGSGRKGKAAAGKGASGKPGGGRASGKPAKGAKAKAKGAKSASRPPAKAAGKAAKVSAERYERKLGAAGPAPSAAKPGKEGGSGKAKRSRGRKYVQVDSGSATASAKPKPGKPASSAPKRDTAPGRARRAEVRRSRMRGR